MTRYSFALGLAASFVCFLSVAGHTPPANATHTFRSEPPNFKDQLWASLEVGAPQIGGNQRIAYSICSASLPATVTAGVEQKWDDIFSRWAFDPVTTSCNQPTKLDWEGASGSCEGITDIACFTSSVFLPAHGNHYDLSSVLILFDINHPDGHTYASFGPNAQTAISAHEWGHNMGLADHAGTPCGVGLLMGETFDVDRKASDNPCFTGPTAAEQTSVECNVYSLCAGVRVAVGDIFPGDGGCDEIITAPGPGPDSWVRVWDAPSGGCISSNVYPRAQFRAYPRGFQGGVYVAAGNVDTSTPEDEVITGADAGGGPHVIVWRINAVNGTATAVISFFPYNPFSGGVRVGAGNLNCGGGDEILTAPGPGRPTEVRTYLSNLSLYGNFQPYPGFTAGAFAAGGDFSAAYCGDQLATGANQGGGPHVRVFCCASGIIELAGWFAYDPAFGGGVRVAAANVQEGVVDAEHEVITGSGPGGTHVRVWNTNGSEIPSGNIFPYPGFGGGVYVSGGNVNGGSAWEVITGAGEGGGPHVRIWSCCSPAPAEIIGWFAY